MPVQMLIPFLPVFVFLHCLLFVTVEEADMEIIFRVRNWLICQKF